MLVTRRMTRAPLLALVLTAVAAAAVACGGADISDLGTLGDDRNPTPTPTPEGGKHHPEGWAAPEAHGHAAKFVTEDCRGCHGTQLEGGAAVSCDSCHAAGWRTTCTFCHGGTDNPTGAPPRDITGAVAQDDLIFKSHTKHVQTTSVATPFTCVQCHGGVPADALDPEHWFDSTHGRAEVTFAAGLSDAGTYDEDNGRCSNLYCHGNGRGDNGTASYSDGPKTCGSCHPFKTSTSAQISTMSGRHRLHIISESSDCVECHGMTVDAMDAISDPSKHVDGQREMLFTGTNVTYNAGTKRCNGSCHGHNHQNESW